jgi:hypothetical protein
MTGIDTMGVVLTQMLATGAVYINGRQRAVQLRDEHTGLSGSRSVRSQRSGL